MFGKRDDASAHVRLRTREARAANTCVRATYEPFGLTTPTRGNAVFVKVETDFRKLFKAVRTTGERKREDSGSSEDSTRTVSSTESVQRVYISAHNVSQKLNARVNSSDEEPTHGRRFEVLSLQLSQKAVYRNSRSQPTKRDKRARKTATYSLVTLGSPNAPHLL